MHTPPPWRKHDAERATIVAGQPGGEVANCTNGFGDQEANAAFIVRTVNNFDALVAACERLLADYLALWDGITDEPRDRPLDETVRVARAALARAKE